MTPDLITTPGVVVSGNAAPQNGCHSLSARVGRPDPTPWTEAKIVGGGLPLESGLALQGQPVSIFPVALRGQPVSGMLRPSAP